LLAAWLLLGCAATAQGRPARGYTVRVGPSVVEVSIAGGDLALTDEQLLRWIRRSATAVAGYYGRFPVPLVQLNISTQGGPGVGHGLARPGRPPTISISVGEEAAQRNLDRDWVLTHEMVHVGFPSLADRHHWMEEGLATYVEPFARLRTGGLTAETVWGDMLRDMWQGLPTSGDQGLDGTPTWGRTYWGGAMFWLLADVRLRFRTNNKKGVEHVLRAILAEGGHMSIDWPISRILAVAERATGVPVLRELYESLRDRPGGVNLDQLWRELGVSFRAGRVQFDDRAPLAGVRRAINLGG
jgi:hypothetical protein